MEVAAEEATEAVTVPAAAEPAPEIVRSRVVLELAAELERLETEHDQAAAAQSDAAGLAAPPEAAPAEAESKCCVQCGSQYRNPTQKFCAECGTPNGAASR